MDPEREKPPAAIGRRDEDEIDGRQRHEREADEVAIVEAGREHHDRDHQRQRHRRAEVGLQQDQRDDEPDDQSDRQQRIGQIVDAVHPALEDQRREEHARDLRELRRLNPRPPTPNHRRVPFTGALNRTAISMTRTKARRHQMNGSLR